MKNMGYTVPVFIRFDDREFLVKWKKKEQLKQKRQVPISELVHMLVLDYGTKKTKSTK
jgi:hypothetical protein